MIMKKLGYKNKKFFEEDTSEVLNTSESKFYVTSREFRPFEDMPIWELPHVAWKETKDGYEIIGSYRHRYEAEDACVVEAAQEIEDNKERFLFVLEKLDNSLSESHREGHCEHYGYCGIIPVLLQFLQSKDGEKTLELFGDWYTLETPSELYEKLCSDVMNVSDWIHEDEVQDWLDLCRENEILYAIKDKGVIESKNSKIGF